MIYLDKVDSGQVTPYTFNYRRQRPKLFYCVTSAGIRSGPDGYRNLARKSWSTLPCDRHPRDLTFRFRLLAAAQCLGPGRSARGGVEKLPLPQKAMVNRLPTIRPGRLYGHCETEVEKIRSTGQQYIALHRQRHGE